MATYQVPPDMKEKEKIIGGILNINQLLWLLVGLAIGAGVFILLFGIIGGVPALVIGFIFALSTTPFIFVKKKELTLFDYFKYKFSFKRKTPYLPNIRKDVEF